jgi:hypothetical protein
MLEDFALYGVRPHLQIVERSGWGSRAFVDLKGCLKVSGVRTGLNHSSCPPHLKSAYHVF